MTNQRASTLGDDLSRPRTSRGGGTLLGSVVLALLLGAAALLAPIVGLAPAPRASAETCQFILGFAALHSLIPDQVGQCTENEHHNAVNGDGLQATTGPAGAGGLLVWRKSDNWTAYTDGYRTWVNGPFGLRERLNQQRFSWEQNPDRLAIVPPPTAGDRCHTAQLTLDLVNVDAGAGNLVGTFRFTNNAAVSCTFYGFVGAGLLDSASNPLPTKVVRGGGWMTREPGPTLISVPAGGAADFKMHWEQVPVGDEVTCSVSTQIAVTPPDELVPVIIPAEIHACGGGQLDVSAVQFPSAGPIGIPRRLH